MQEKRGERKIMSEEVMRMRMEKMRRSIKDLRELKEYIENELIQAYEERNKALMLGNDKMFFYALGKHEVYRSLIALLTDEGLLFYRYVPEEQPKKEEDTQGYQ